MIMKSQVYCSERSVCVYGRHKNLLTSLTIWLDNIHISIKSIGISHNINVYFTNFSIFTFTVLWFYILHAHLTFKYIK